MTAEPVPAGAATSRRVGSTSSTTQIPRPAPIGRRTAIVALLVGSVLNLVEALAGRVVGGGDSVSGTMEAWAARPTLTAIGIAIGTLAVPFLLLAVVAMGQLIRPRMPRLGAVGMGFGFAGGLGFFALHAVIIVQLIASEQPDRAAMVSLIETAQSHPLGLIFILPFTVGLFGAVLLASIGFLRTRVVPVWIPAALLLFVVLDVATFPTGPVDPHWLFVTACVGLAVKVAKMTDRQWWAGTATA